MRNCAWTTALEKLTTPVIPTNFVVIKKTLAAIGDKNASTVTLD
jgi:hypothetical protein